MLQRIKKIFVNMPVVSIIVPIFNQETYLRECLESISTQSFSDFEVIMVDDGSIDLSAEICREFGNKDRRFKYIYKNNGGVSSARNVGLACAKGNYVIFVDSDDRLPENALQNHLKHFPEEVDMTTGSFLAFSDEEPEAYRVEVERSEIVSRDKCLYDFTPNDKVDWQRYLWNRMLRMSIIRENSIRFNEKIAYKEDGLFLVQYLLKCKGQVAYFLETVYCYRQNPSSAMGALSSGRTEKLVTNIDAHALIIKEMRTADVPDDILGKEVRHAFQSRRWVLDKLYSSKYYHKAWLRTLYKLLLAVGFVTSAKILVDGVDRKTKNIILQNKR